MLIVGVIVIGFEIAGPGPGRRWMLKEVPKQLNGSVSVGLSLNWILLQHLLNKLTTANDLRLTFNILREFHLDSSSDPSSMLHTHTHRCRPESK